MDTLKTYGFKYLSIKDKKLFDHYYDRMNDNWASSISFASMIAWNYSIKIYHRIIGEYLCCLAQDTTCNRWVILPFLGFYEKDKLEQCAKEFKSILEKLQIPIVFTDVSEWMLPYYMNLKSIKLKENYDLGLSDYIYKAGDFEKTLNSQESRYDYNYFIRKNNPELVLMSNENINTYIEFLTKIWCSSHDCDYCQYGCLLDSAKSIINVVNEVGAKGITVYVDNEIVGYTIVTMEKDQLIFHFKKNIHKYRGLSDYMHKQCYELYGSPAKIINYTEDINLEGLRKYKQKLAKYELHHKYELCRIG